MHPSCNANYEWKNPKTLEEWEKDPSRKLDVLAEILRHHLESNNAPPLHVKDDKLVPADSPQIEIRDLGPDKIVVYSAFPSSFQLIEVSFWGVMALFICTYARKVLKLHGIQTLQLNGSMNMSSRSQALQSFRSSDEKGPRVLVLSNVGMTGLNLPCANILVILVRL